MPALIPHRRVRSRGGPSIRPRRAPRPRSPPADSSRRSGRHDPPVAPAAHHLPRTTIRSARREPSGARRFGPPPHRITHVILEATLPAPSTHATVSPPSCELPLSELVSHLTVAIAVLGLFGTIAAHHPDRCRRCHPGKLTPRMRNERTRASGPSCGESESRRPSFVIKTSGARHCPPPSAPVSRTDRAVRCRGRELR